MKDDLRRVVERIARFIDVGDQGAIETAIEHSSFEFMSEHREPFSEPWPREHLARVLGIPVESDATKVREGTVGRNRQELTAPTRERLDEIWQETIADEFGYGSYGALDSAIRAANR